MHLLLVVAVPLSLSSAVRPFWRWLIAFPLILISSLTIAQDTAPTPYLSADVMTGYLARIGFNDPEQLAEALMRVEDLYDFDAGDQLIDPVAIVVHGPEVSIFQKINYQQHKDIVDLAARLTALGILDINVCETRLGLLGAEKDSVYPFVDTVPFGPAEVDRLLDEENYVYF